MSEYTIPISVFLLLSCVFVQGQIVDSQGGKASEANADSSFIKLNFPEGVAVKVLIDYVSDRLGKNILYDEGVGQKRVTIRCPVGVPAESLMGFLRITLKMSGCSLVDAEEKGWLKVIANKDFLEATKDVKDDTGVLADAEGMEVLTQVFQLKHAIPEEVAKSIKPFLSKPGGDCFSIASADALIVTDYASNIRRIAEIISMVDRPGGQVEVIFVSLQNTEPGALATSLTSLLQKKDAMEAGDASKTSRRRSRGGASGSGVVAFPQTNRIAVIVEPWNKAEVMNFIKILDSPSDAKKQKYRFEYVSPGRIMKLIDSVYGEEFKGRYQSAFDDESGLLLVSGPEKLHVQIEALKKELDVAENDPLHREIKFYVIKNAMATDVLATIEALDLGAVFKESILNQEAVKSGLAAESFTGPNNPPPAMDKPLPRPPAFRLTEESNKTSPTYKATSESSGDKPLTVVTADLNTNSIIVIAPATLQAMYAKLIEGLDKRRPQVLVEVTMATMDKAESLSLGVELLKAGTMGASEYLTFTSFGLSTPDLTTGSLALNPGTGFNGTVINAGVFSAVVRALSTNSHAKVVSSPRILVNDNATAQLTSIQEQPYTSVNASETVSTTSFAGYASAGSTLTVTPHISEGEHLNLKYTITLNSFSGEGSEGVPAPRQTNELTSEVTVPDGYVVVVGGLKRQDVSRSKTKVPLLGDIPYFGELFSRTDNSDSESVLFVFIRPVILRDDEFKSLKYISEIHLEKAKLDGNYPSSETMIMN